MSEDRVVREVFLASQPNKRFVEVDAIGDIVVFLHGEAIRLLREQWVSDGSDEIDQVKRRNCAPREHELHEHRAGVVIARSWATIGEVLVRTTPC